MKNINISNNIISANTPVFIIAEAGVNHNGSLTIAKKLVDAASKAGADAIKFQTFKAEDVVTRAGKMADYQRLNTGKSESQLVMLKKLEMPESFYKPLIKYCKNKNIIFLSTPHGGFSAVDLLLNYQIPAFKFGSGDLTNLPLLKYAAKAGKPMILSTGMANITEIKEAISIIKKSGNNQIIALHCTTNYPCPPEEVNLNAMLTMMEKLSVIVGYSDHTIGIQVPIMAAALGASVIEKHFTLDRKMNGPDHKASLEPDELEEMVDSIRKIPLIFGSKVKKPSSSELKMIKTVRKSVVAVKDIEKGEIFSKQNLGIKRPGTGLSPKYWFSLLGKHAKRRFKVDEFIEI